MRQSAHQGAGVGGHFTLGDGSACGLGQRRQLLPDGCQLLGDAKVG